ncbi:hypothetical protein FRB93_009905 [Tulasnella sp. JGI-2019a]|nr:hypothetical protein FRB93_009905 [Tulasnella sp. JGI-2019a]
MAEQEAEWVPVPQPDLAPKQPAPPGNSLMKTKCAANGRKKPKVTAGGLALRGSQMMPDQNRNQDLCLPESINNLPDLMELLTQPMMLERKERPAVRGKSQFVELEGQGTEEEEEEEDGIDMYAEDVQDTHSNYSDIHREHGRGAESLIADLSVVMDDEEDTEAKKL